MTTLPFASTFENRFTDPLAEQRLYVRAGDRLPSFVAQIEDEFGDPYDLTGLQVFLSFRSLNGDIETAWVGEREITVVTPTDGIVFYDWQPEDLEVPHGEWEALLTASDGTDYITFPTQRTTVVSVRPKVYATAFVTTADRRTVLTADGRIVRLPLGN